MSSGHTVRLSVSASFVIICVFVVGFLINEVRVEVVPFYVRFANNAYTFSTIFFLQPNIYHNYALEDGAFKRWGAGLYKSPPGGEYPAKRNTQFELLNY